jgi:acetoin utilization protein AcuA
MKTTETLPENINQRTLPVGQVRIRSCCTADEIRRYEFSPQFGSHARYRSLYTHRVTLEDNADQPDANVTLALAEDRLIVGFGVLTYPEPEERWSQLEPRVMMEVKAIEVSATWRSKGIAKSILELLVGPPMVEDKIVYMVGYSWTWDLDGARKTAQQYRQMLIRLFEPYGFIEYQTNEPNICLKPENIFMGRVGKNISTDVQNAFKWLRFGMGS